MSATSSGTGRPRLTILTPPLQGRSFILTGPVATIGRNPECEIILDQASISRQHARITEEKGHFVLRDLDSRNGITVGGNPVRESILENGDLFTVGDIEMRFEIIGASAPGSAPQKGAPSTAVAPSRAPAIPAGWQPVTPGTGQAAPSPAATQGGGSAKLNVKLLIAAVVGLLLAVGVSALILGRNKDTSSGVIQIPTILIRVGENRWLSISKADKDGNKRPAIATLEVSPDQIVQVTKLDDPWEYVVSGVSGGEADVKITKEDGTIGVMRVLVRGRIENSLDDLTYAQLSDVERRARAHYYVESGRALQAERPYLAQQQYECALAVLSKLTKGEDYLAASRGLIAAKTAVDAKWEKIAGEIRVALSNHDAAREGQLLEEALKLIPDENDWRNQKVRALLQSIFLPQMTKRK